MKTNQVVLSTAAAAFSGALLFTSAPAGADVVIEVIYSKIAGHPTSIVPGALDQNGDPLVIEFRQFDQFTGNVDHQWYLRAQNQQIAGPDLRSMVLIGEGTEMKVIFQRGLPFPGAVGDEVHDFSGGGAGWNDDGDFAFRIRASGGSSSNFQKIMKSVGGVISVAFEGGNAPGGDPYTGLEGPAGTPQTGNAGNSIGSTHLLNNGMIGTHDGGVHNMTSTLFRPVLAYDLQKFMQRNVDTVTGLGGVGTELIGGFTGFNADSFFATPDFDPFGGSGAGTWIVRGQIDQPSDQNVVIVNHEVVMRQNHGLPSDGSVVVNTMLNTGILSNGDWYVRGTEVGAGGLAVRNGVVIAKQGDEISSGSREHWAGTGFSAFYGNNNGDWVIAGQTDNADPAKNFVVVVNGEVVIREGDEVAVDGVDAFIGRVNPATNPWGADSFYLTDDKVLYFLADIHDGKGTEHNLAAFGTPRALLRADLGDPGKTCPGDLTGDGNVGVADLLALLACWGPVEPGCEAADLDGAGHVGVADLLILLSLWGPCP